MLYREAGQYKTSYAADQRCSLSAGPDRHCGDPSSAFA